MSVGWKQAKGTGVYLLLLLLVLATLGGGVARWMGRYDPAPIGAGEMPPAGVPDTVVGPRAARYAMSAVSAARRLLLEHDPAQAARYLDRANRYLAHLVNQPMSAGATGIYVTLYSQFTLPEDGTQRWQAQRQLQRLAGPVQRGEHEIVVAELRQTGLPFVYRYLDLPVADAAREVQQALVALRQNDSDQARSILARLEQGLRETVVNVNSVSQTRFGANGASNASPARLPTLATARVNDRGADS